MAAEDAPGMATTRGATFWARDGAQKDADIVALLDACVDFAVFSVDPLGNVTTWSRGAERLTGLRPGEAIGRDFAFLWTPEDVAARKPYLELEDAATQGRVEIDGWVRRRDGSRFWATGVCRPMQDDDGRVSGFVKVLRDGTKRREAELLRGQEHERLKQFQSLVVHELRNPLAPMLIQLRLLRMRATGPQEVRSLDVLERNLLRVQRLCDDLADAAHLQLGTFPIEGQATDLARLVREAGETLAHAAKDAGVTLRIDAPGALPAHADPHRIAQVLHNLVANALRATPEGGEVSLWARGLPDGRVRIECRDTGLGMTPQTLAQLFQPFTGAIPNAGAGMGLGLYLSKAIVRGHGGDVWAESKGLGAGSTFIVELPLTGPASRDLADPGLEGRTQEATPRPGDVAPGLGAAANAAAAGGTVEATSRPAVRPAPRGRSGPSS